MSVKIAKYLKTDTFLLTKDRYIQTRDGYILVAVHSDRQPVTRLSLGGGGGWVHYGDGRILLLKIILASPDSEN